MLGTFPHAARPLAATPRLPRPFALAAVSGEYGFAAWSFSRQSKLNAWSFHGLGGDTLYAMATLGNYVYARRDGTDFVDALLPNTFYAEGDTNTESTSVEAVTQWLDFGKPGKLKALTGIDMDVLGVETVEIYVFIPNPDDPRDRTGTLASSLSLVDADGGWTYNGELISTEDVGAATEFQLRFVGEANREVQINRLTLYWDDVAG
jgi:hypothetical protein